MKIKVSLNSSTAQSEGWEGMKVEERLKIRQGGEKDGLHTSY